MQSARARAAIEAADARARADVAARHPAGAVPGARRRQHAGRPGRDGLHHQPDAGERSSHGAEYQARIVQALLDGGRRASATSSPRAAPAARAAQPDRADASAGRRRAARRAGRGVARYRSWRRRRAARLAPAAVESGRRARGAEPRRRRRRRSAQAVLRRRGRPAPQPASSATCRSAKAPPSRPAHHRGAARSRRRRRSSPRFPPGTTLRRSSSPSTATPSSTSAARSREPSRRQPRRTLRRVRDRQRAHREPAGDQARADPHRRPGSGHAGRPRRSPPPAAARISTWVEARPARTSGHTDRRHAETRRLRSDNRLRRPAPPDHASHRTISMHAEGSVLIEAGRTRVICTASVEDRVPPFLRNSGKGWVTAEYGMLPRATTTRTHARGDGGQGRRTDAGDPAADRPLAAIGRRSSTELGERTIWIDCDVIQADGGTRTASITGALRRAGAGAAAAARAGHDQDDPGHGLRRRDQRRHRRRRRRCSTSPTTRTRAPTST